MYYISYRDVTAKKDASLLSVLKYFVYLRSTFFCLEIHCLLFCLKTVQGLRREDQSVRLKGIHETSDCKNKIRRQDRFVENVWQYFVRVVNCNSWSRIVMGEVTNLCSGKSHQFVSEIIILFVDVSLHVFTYNVLFLCVLPHNRLYLELLYTWEVPFVYTYHFFSF